MAGYGAPAKGNTLLNYCGIGPELLRFTVDRSPHKQGRYLPGVQIPIYAPERICRDAARTTFSSCPGICATRSWSRWRGFATGAAEFVVPIPNVQVF